MTDYIDDHNIDEKQIFANYKKNYGKINHTTYSYVDVEYKLSINEQTYLILEFDIELNDTNNLDLHEMVESVSLKIDDKIISAYKIVSKWTKINILEKLIDKISFRVNICSNNLLFPILKNMNASIIICYNQKYNYINNVLINYNKYFFDENINHIFEQHINFIKTANFQCDENCIFSHEIGLIDKYDKFGSSLHNHYTPHVLEMLNLFYNTIKNNKYNIVIESITNECHNNNKYKLSHDDNINYISDLCMSINNKDCVNISKIIKSISVTINDSLIDIHSNCNEINFYLKLYNKQDKMHNIFGNNMDLPIVVAPFNKLFPIGNIKNHDVCIVVEYHENYIYANNVEFVCYKYCNTNHKNDSVKTLNISQNRQYNKISFTCWFK